MLGINETKTVITPKTNDENIKASIRSNMPPCPGKTLLKSLILTLRLIQLKNKSPKIPEKTIMNAIIRINIHHSGPCDINHVLVRIPKNK
ncbi:hypothetical protein FACS1894218_0530 [Bacilli bacterium]|nr:hypothetical protein FACS1894218_0530 [Bacilli bacterium]